MLCFEIWPLTNALQATDYWSPYMGILSRFELEALESFWREVFLEGLWLGVPVVEREGDASVVRSPGSFQVVDFDFVNRCIVVRWLKEKSDSELFKCENTFSQLKQI